jgi:predicted dehydrogenase
MIKAGIIGLGRMGVSHCAIVNAHHDIQLMAVCEPSSFVAAAMEKYAGIPCYKDFRKMFDSEHLDCVLVTTPTRFHFEMVKYALERGLHVFVEKPFCLTPEEGATLVDLAKQKKVVNQVGYHNRFIGTFREMKRLVDTGAIGEVYHVLGEAYGPVVLKAKGGTWRSNTKEGGGCLYDYATHVINLIQYTVGSPVAVRGAILKSIYSSGVDDAVHSSLHFQGGISGQLSVNWSDETYRKMSTQLTILAKKGKIVADAQELKVYFKEQPTEPGYEKGWNMRWVTDLSLDVGFYLRGEEYSAQIEYFIECIKNDEFDNINSFANSYETDYVADLIKKDSKIKEVA